jgi:multidrug efflux system membrane fusion protein
MLRSRSYSPKCVWFIRGSFIFLSLMLAACSSKSAPPASAAPVIVASVGQKAVPYEIRTIGNVEANASVIVKSQIGGILSKIHFQKGQFVNKGALLFTIDPRPLQATLMQAQGALARDNAQLINARDDEKRYAELVKKGYISKQQYDQQRTAADALEATVNADKAAVAYAKLQVSYCYIHSPISGHLGDILIDEGNIVKANDDNKSLTTIRQVQPISVTFSVPEKNLAEIKKYRAEKQLTVEVYFDNPNQKPEKGVLSFIDNTVDPTTGTIKLKGTLKNEKNQLWPGQFVNVLLFLYTQQDAIVIPSQAIQAGQMGQYVYVVSDALQAEVRPVTVTRTFGGESIIEKGLKPGEKVITDGQLRVVPGGKVAIKEEVEAPKESAPPPAQQQKKEDSAAPAKTQEKTEK